MTHPIAKRGEEISDNLVRIAEGFDHLARSACSDLATWQRRMCSRYAAFARELAGRPDVCCDLAIVKLPRRLLQRCLVVTRRYRLPTIGFRPSNEDPEHLVPRGDPYSSLVWARLLDAAQSGSGTFNPYDDGMTWNWMEISIGWEEDGSRNSSGLFDHFHVISEWVQLPIECDEPQLRRRLLGVCRPVLGLLQTRVGGFRKRDGTIHVRLFGLTGDVDDPDRDRGLLSDFYVATANTNIKGITSNVARVLARVLGRNGWTEPSRGAPPLAAPDHARWWAQVTLDGLTARQIAQASSSVGLAMEVDRIKKGLRRMAVTRKVV